MDRGRPAQGAERGFTLLELMVVVLVIAVLLAIAVPTFLGARSRAQDRAAQALLRSALLAQDVVAADGARFSEDLAVLAAVEPGIRWSDEEPVGAPGTVHVDVNVWQDGGNEVTLGARSASGRCFYVRKLLREVPAGTPGHWARTYPTAWPAGTTYGSSSGCGDGYFVDVSARSW